jgi:hypothetical protein
LGADNRYRGPGVRRPPHPPRRRNRMIHAPR